MFAIQNRYTSFLLLLFTTLLFLNSGFEDDRVPKWGFSGGWIRDASQQGQPWPDPSNIETPYAQITSPKLPTTSAKYLAQICPFMVGKEVCCDDDGILVMYENFKTIDSLFGDCLLCSTNLK